MNVMILIPEAILPSQYIFSQYTCRSCTYSSTPIGTHLQLLSKFAFRLLSPVLELQPASEDVSQLLRAGDSGTTGTVRDFRGRNPSGRHRGCQTTPIRRTQKETQQNASRLGEEVGRVGAAEGKGSFW